MWNVHVKFRMHIQNLQNKNKNLLVYNGLVHLPDTPTMK